MTISFLCVIGIQSKLLMWYCFHYATPCIILLQPHHSFSTSTTSSLFKAGGIWTCCFFCQFFLLDFLTFLSSNITFSERPSLNYLSKIIPTSQSPFLVLLCQATVLCYGIIQHFLILSCLSVTSLSSVFPPLNAASMGIRTCCILFTTGSPAPRKYLMHKIS